jgi:BirA family biotin operon repressor/biotin-[acetyl-CoA-carboxylase] ligase
MPIAAELAQDPGTPSGLIVVAEEQTSGRGRSGRTWQAPYASALLVSIVLKPPQCNLPAAALTMLAGNALLAATAAVVPPLQGELHLKWPNDLVVGSDPLTAREVAGILAESSLQPDGTMRYAILGIGINVNQQASDLPRIAPPTPRPTSLRVANNQVANNQVANNQINEKTESDRLIDRGYLLVHLCQQLAKELARTPAESYQRWKSHLATLGHTVAVYANGPEQPATLVGQAVDVQDDGALIVVDATGTQHRVHAADVSLRAR